ncbi:MULTISPECIES: hypothetical protein [unclassified Brenneria]|uniref:hypothetical protein n=1 Tax=unclassified Brenneria TaxID=2634434 RepID=UPI0015528328|nr:hypothetical protein [Brenneria sp. hezel4-2-4]MEE3652024.1 hypothetical protein [Brenneria sp. HEZEL_4_2_4]NPD01982.1 hypothetical protein [Brenneria sp. hezel4-2-4]
MKKSSDSDTLININSIEKVAARRAQLRTMLGIDTGRMDTLRTTQTRRMRYRVWGFVLELNRFPS